MDDKDKKLAGLKVIQNLDKDFSTFKKKYFSSKRSISPIQSNNESFVEVSGQLTYKDSKRLKLRKDVQQSEIVKYFKQWQKYDMLSTLFSLIGLVFSVVFYELKIVHS